MRVLPPAHNFKPLTLNYEFVVKNNDIIKIVGYVSGVIPVKNYEIDNSSNMLLYIKTIYANNLININNSYQIYNSNDKTKIINELYNKSTSNFRLN